MIRTLIATIVILSAATAAWSADAPPSASAIAKAATISPKGGAYSGSSAPADITPPKPFVYTPMDSDIVAGKKEAPVTIVEYASLSCPHCSHFFLHALPALTEKYIDTGKVRFVYRHYPLNEPALKAAELVQCAPPDKRHAYVKVLFSTQLKWAYDANFRDGLTNIAVLGGMDRLAFEHCMNDKSVEKAILNIAKDAADKYKVNSTPTFFIDGIEYKGDRDPDSMGKVIDAEYAKQTKK